MNSIKLIVFFIFNGIMPSSKQIINTLRIKLFGSWNKTSLFKSLHNWCAIISHPGNGVKIWKDDHQMEQVWENKVDELKASKIFSCMHCGLVLSCGINRNFWLTSRAHFFNKKKNCISELTVSLQFNSLW